MLHPKIHFGKYKGATYNQIPLDYKFWLVTTRPQTLEKNPDFLKKLLDDEEHILEATYTKSDYLYDYFGSIEDCF